MIVGIMAQNAIQRKSTPPPLCPTMFPALLDILLPHILNTLANLYFTVTHEKDQPTNECKSFWEQTDKIPFPVVFYW